MSRRTGFTLLELIVVLAVLGVMAGIVGVALGTPRAAPTARDAWRRTVAAARARALATGRPVHVPPPAEARAGREFTALPDGSVLAAAGEPVPGNPTDTTAAAQPVDRLTGHVSNPVPTGHAEP